MSVEGRLNQIWYEGAVGGRLMAPLSWVYEGVTRLRRRAFADASRRTRVGAPVIMVGNLSVGGTGKTPLVAWLAWQLGSLGRRVGIASRGYGSAGRRLLEVDPGAD